MLSGCLGRLNWLFFHDWCIYTNAAIIVGLRAENCLLWAVFRSVRVRVARVAICMNMGACTKPKTGAVWANLVQFLTGARGCLFVCCSGAVWARYIPKNGRGLFKCIKPNEGVLFAFGGGMGELCPAVRFSRYLRLAMAERVNAHRTNDAKEMGVLCA